MAKRKRLDQFGNPDDRRATFGPAGPAGEGSPVSSDSQWPVPVRDRGKAPDRPGVPFNDGKHPDRSSLTGSGELTGPLADAIPPERDAQGEGTGC
jgi:hypothetical protein